MAGHGEEEFDEGEVWDVLRDHGEEAAVPDFTPPWSRRGKNKVAMPRVGEDASAGARGKGRRSSAPVPIPSGCSLSQGRRGEEDEEEGEEMLPPHEWLARKMERLTTVPASSPPEIRGRRKGREMRKIRDAVLPKTAFSEQ